MKFQLREATIGVNSLECRPFKPNETAVIVVGAAAFDVFHGGEIDVEQVRGVVLTP
jgi:hypothetical protein